MERRTFLRGVSLTGAGLIAGMKAMPGSPVPYPVSPGLGEIGDENFWRTVKQQFIIAKDYSFLNTGSIGLQPYSVINKVHEMMIKDQADPSPGHNQDDWNRIKGKIAAILGEGISADEIALTNSATEGINIMINCLDLKPGDEVITSTHEHVALNLPLLNNMARRGIVIRTFDPDAVKASGNVDRIRSLITDKTRLIILAHVTCTTGQVQPVVEIGQLASERGIIFGLDGAQAPGNIEVRIPDYNCDFYAFSSHKWMLAPKRTGVLYVKKDRQDLLHAITVGGYSDEKCSMADRIIELKHTAQKFEYGTLNPGLYYGFEEAMDMLNNIGLDNVFKHNHELSNEFYNEILKINGAEVLSPAEQVFRSSMITFRIKDKKADDISTHLAPQKIRVRVVHEADLNAIRISFHVYNDYNDLEKLLGGIQEFIKS
jgi:selenocysteine lyase/cysteine desulfurase